MNVTPKLSIISDQRYAKWSSSSNIIQRHTKKEHLSFIEAFLWVQLYTYIVVKRVKKLNFHRFQGFLLFSFVDILSYIVDFFCFDIYISGYISGYSSSLDLQCMKKHSFHDKCSVLAS